MNLFQTSEKFVSEVTLMDNPTFNVLNRNQSFTESNAYSRNACNSFEVYYSKGIY